MKVRKMIGVKCPVCNGSNFYETGSKFDGSLMGLDDIVMQAFGNKVRYTICKDCKNIQFWFNRNDKTIG